MMTSANLLILLTDSVSARFVSQISSRRVSAGSLSDFATVQRISSLSKLTHCQEKADKLSVGLMTDTLSLFRECHVSPVSGREEEPLLSVAWRIGKSSRNRSVKWDKRLEENSTHDFRD